MGRKKYDTYLGYYDGPPIGETFEDRRHLKNAATASAQLKAAILKAGLRA